MHAQAPKVFFGPEYGLGDSLGAFCVGDYRYGENIQQAALRSFTGKDRAAR